MAIVPAIIGLYSPAPQCGKSSVSGILCEAYGYQRDRFAKTMKAMLRVLLLDLGYAEQDCDELLDGHRKEEVVRVLNVTCRHLMQTIGTEWGRKCVSESMWVDITLARAHRSSNPIVIDDVRFANEYAAGELDRAFLVKITRPGDQYAAVPGHASNGALECATLFPFHYHLHNDGTPQELERKVIEMMDFAADWCDNRIP